MSQKQLRIAVADDEAECRQFLSEALTSLGHAVVSVAESGAQLVNDCLAQNPDLAVTDIVMPGIDGLEAAGQIYRNQAIPIVIVSAYHDPEFLERAGKQHILGYLVKPVKQSDLLTAITIAMRRFREFEALRSETDNLRQALEDRKTIERAKGILMKTASLDESAAFLRLQNTAQKRGIRVVEVAQMIVTTADVLASGDHVKR